MSKKEFKISIGKSNSAQEEIEIRIFNALNIILLNINDLYQNEKRQSKIV